jgi:hypothetical protein
MTIHAQAGARLGVLDCRRLERGLVLVLFRCGLRFFDV